jgi:signal transduction histidine kinase
LRGKEQPTRRSAKPAKSRVEAKPPIIRKSRKSEGASVHDLEKRLAEALEQQAATAEILRVISSSPNDVQPVFDAVADSGARLCESFDSIIWRPSGDRLVVVAHHGPIPIDAGGLPLTRESVPARALLDGRTFHLPDLQAEADEFPVGSDLARRHGFRTVLNVPLMRDGAAIGVITLRRTEVKLFTDRQVALLQTFANQAVIAIENVRLLNETKEALEQQTATSEILRVIASSPTDVRPVFEAILKRAATLCEAQLGHLWLYEGGEQFRLGAGYGSRPDHLQWLQQGLHRFGRPFFRESGPWRVGQVLDVRDTEPYRRGEPVWIRTADHEGMRTLLAVPLVKDGRLVGSIAVYRREVQPFTDQQTALVQTFADQAVIAIENVRLFKELEVANRELAAASQHKSEFLANMSHELRTPLNAIIGFSEVLSEKMFGELNEKQAEYSQDIHASGQYLLSLINDILDLSKIEAGRMELELSDFHLPTALDSTLTLVRERAGRRSIVLHLSVDERLGQIQADERKVRQVVLNLLSNAIKFTPEGGRIEVMAAPKDGVVEVSVSDTGVGIAPEDQEAVFEEFRQVGTAAKKVEGTGLGLALSRKFIELHGGRIWVQSQLGIGSTFTFSIPLRRRE